MLLSLRSNPQTESPYMENCDGLYTRKDLSQKVTYYLWWMLWYFKEFKNAKLDEWQKMLLSLRSNP